MDWLNAKPWLFKEVKSTVVTRNMLKEISGYSVYIQKSAMIYRIVYQTVTHSTQLHNDI